MLGNVFAVRLNIAKNPRIKFKDVWYIMSENHDISLVPFAATAES